MDLPGATQQVWIFLKESDQWQHRPLFMAILYLLRREGVAGAMGARAFWRRWGPLNPILF